MARYAERRANFSGQAMRRVGVAPVPGFPFTLTRMARPKNKIPTGLLAARVPLELIETVRREADAAGMRLGEFLAQAMEAACNECMWARLGNCSPRPRRT